MAPPDQQECLAVVDTLRAWGFAEDRELLAAAALHDLGKSLAPPKARYRVAVTVLETLPPLLFRWLARHSQTFAVLQNHARLGAELAARAGLSEEIQRLIEGHHSAGRDARSQALQQADALH